MWSSSLALGWRPSIYFLAGVVAGVSNGVAGGTLFAFPTSLAKGLPR